MNAFFNADHLHDEIAGLRARLREVEGERDAAVKKSEAVGKRLAWQLEKGAGIVMEREDILLRRAEAAEKRVAELEAELKDVREFAKNALSRLTAQAELLRARTEALERIRIVTASQEDTSLYGYIHRQAGDALAASKKKEPTQ